MSEIHLTLHVPGAAETGIGATTQAESREPTEDGGSRKTGSPFGALMPFIVIGVLFWMLILGPERKAKRRQAEMRRNIKKNDEVMTTSGIYGRVSRVEDDVVTLVVADGVRMRFARSSIQGLVGEDPKDAKGPRDAKGPQDAKQAKGANRARQGRGEESQESREESAKG